MCFNCFCMADMFIPILSFKAWYVIEGLSSNASRMVMEFGLRKEAFSPSYHQMSGECSLTNIVLYVISSATTFRK